MYHQQAQFKDVFAMPKNKEALSSRNNSYNYLMQKSSLGCCLQDYDTLVTRHNFKFIILVFNYSDNKITNSEII